MKIKINYNPKSGLDSIEADLPDSVHATPRVVWCNHTQTAHVLGEEYNYDEVPFMHFDAITNKAIFRDRLENTLTSKGDLKNGK